MTIPYLDVILNLEDPQRVFRSTGFRTDALALAAIPQAQFDALFFALDSETEGFAGGIRISQLVHEHITERAQADAAKQFILYFARHRRAKKKGDGPTYVKATLKNILDALGEKKVDSGSLSTLEVRLPVFLAEHPVIDRQLKADELLRRVGNRAITIDLICDLRPVFDQERKTIDGLIPLTTLKIVAARSGAVEPMAVTEVVLTEKTLDSLEEKIKHVRNKLTAMKAYVSNTGIRVPEIQGALSDEDGDGDH